LRTLVSDRLADVKNVEVDLLITLGSALALPGVGFGQLDPAAPATLLTADLISERLRARRGA
jgi:hypothetical protein